MTFALYISSILVAGGFCLGLAYNAGCVVFKTPGEKQYLYLTYLALLEAFYCLFVVPYFRETDPVGALRWILMVSAITPFMTYYFGHLTIHIVEARAAWI